MSWIQATQKGVSYGGLYAVYLDGALVYIGIATNIAKRFAGHGMDCANRVGMFRGFVFEEMAIKVRRLDCKVKRLRVESAMIKRLQPPGNIKQNAAFMPILRRTNIVSHNQQFRRFVRESGSQANAALLLKTSAGYVSLIYAGKRRVSLGMAERVEKASGGKITKLSLIFPHRRKR